MSHLWATWAALRRKRRLAASAVAVATLASSALLASATTTSAAAASATAPTDANLLDGGFEVPDIGGCAVFAKGSTAMKPWNVTAGEVHLSDLACGRPTYQWKTHGGEQSLDLDGTVAGGPGAISQTFSTVTGKDYRVEFWVSGNNFGGVQVKTFTVDAGGEPKAYSFDTGGPTSPTATMPEYKKMTYEFTASGSSTTLTFTSTTSGAGVGYGAVLDDITVVTDDTCNVVGNGGFQSPDIADILQVEKGDSAMAPWEVTAGNVHVTNNGDYSPVGGGQWEAHSGDQSLDLDGATDAPAGAISQSLATKPGSIYTVKFWVSGNNSAGPQVKTFTVNAAPGGKVTDYSFDVGKTGIDLPMPAYVQKEYQFTATARSTTLTFASTTPDGHHGFGAVLDDITACGVPPTPPPPPTTPTPPPPQTPSVPVKINAGGGPASGGGGDPTAPLVGLAVLAAVAGAGFVVIRRRRTSEQG